MSTAPNTIWSKITAPIASDPSQANCDWRDANARADVCFKIEAMVEYRRLSISHSRNHDNTKIHREWLLEPLEANKTRMTINETISIDNPIRRFLSQNLLSQDLFIRQQVAKLKNQQES
ncbi:MAG: hypothetical protein HRU19_32445 [Pseudobacteriovorax sp.]|nr:hypothetical protein [Pseudobacteriovorax sp.]